MRLRSPTASSPHRSRIAARTPLSSARSVCTNSSLDAVAAPWRANASSASLLPAAMPPVSATVNGRGTLFGGDGLVRALGGLGLVFDLDLGRCVELVALQLLGLGFGDGKCRRLIREDVLGKIDGRRCRVLAGAGLQRHPVVDALERQRQTP